MSLISNIEDDVISNLNSILSPSRKVSIELENVDSFSEYEEEVKDQVSTSMMYNNQSGISRFGSLNNNSIVKS